MARGQQQQQQQQKDQRKKQSESRKIQLTINKVNKKRERENEGKKREDEEKRGRWSGSEKESEEEGDQSHFLWPQEKHFFVPPKDRVLAGYYKVVPAENVFTDTRRRGSIFTYMMSIPSLVNIVCLNL